MDAKKLVINSAKIIFAHTNQDDKFGPSVTIATTPEIEEAITNWYVVNHIGDSTPKFKTYTNEETGETTRQFNFKLSPFIQIITEDLRELTLDTILPADALSYGSEVKLIAYAYDYKNAFGAGVSQSASAIRILKKGESRAANDRAELLA